MPLETWHVEKNNTKQGIRSYSDSFNKNAGDSIAWEIREVFKARMYLAWTHAINSCSDGPKETLTETENVDQKEVSLKNATKNG